MGLSLVKFWYQNEDSIDEEIYEEEEVELESETEGDTNEKEEKKATQSSQSPSTFTGTTQIFLIQMDDKVLGYKNTYSSAQRLAKRLMKDYLIQLPLGTHKYWWKRGKGSRTKTTFVLQSLAYNYLLRAPRVETTISIVPVNCIEQFETFHLDSYINRKHTWSFLSSRMI